MKRAAAILNEAVAWCCIIAFVGIVPAVLVGEWGWVARLFVAGLALMFISEVIRNARGVKVVKP